MYYEDIFRGLNSSGIRYLVVGGVALNLHGIPRMTADLDLMVDLSEPNLKCLVDALGELNYLPKPPLILKDFLVAENRRQWLKEKNMRVFSVSHPQKPYQVIDILIENQLDFNQLYSARKITLLGELQIPLVSIEHLSELKRIAGRKQDLADIEALRKLKKILDEKD